MKIIGKFWLYKGEKFFDNTEKMLYNLIFYTNF